MVILFALCYMKYETEGNFAGIGEFINVDENKVKNVAVKFS